MSTGARTPAGMRAKWKDGKKSQTGKAQQQARWRWLVALRMLAAHPSPQTWAACLHALEVREGAERAWTEHLALLGITNPLVNAAEAQQASGVASACTTHCTQPCTQHHVDAPAALCAKSVQETCHATTQEGAAAKDH